MINTEYKRVQMTVTTESDHDLNIPDLTSDLQSSGHITDVQCNECPGIIIIIIVIIMSIMFIIIFYRFTGTRQ